MEAVNYPANWTERVGKFADAVGKPIDEITNALSGVIGLPDDEALSLLNDPSATPDADIMDALKDLKIPTGKLKMHMNKLRGEKPAIVETAEKSTVTINILPALPDTDSFLNMLKVGGDLKVGQTEVLSAVKAALAWQAGLYSIPALLLAKMEDYADKQEEPCGKEFFEVQKWLTEKKYGDVLTVLGAPGTFVSEARKKTFLARLDEHLWDSLKSFHSQLTAWHDTWIKGAANPALVLLAVTNPGGALPPGMMAPPSVSPVRAAAEEVVKSINKVFAGPGIVVARAMAFDATRIITIISDAKVLPQAGYTNRDQMLKDLGVAVGSEIVRVEQDLTQYTLAIMTLSTVNSTNELMYLAAMVNLGITIPWDKLGSKGIGNKKNLRD